MYARNLGALCIINFAAALLLATCPALASPESKSGDLRGTWRVQVQPVSCSTATPAGPAFSALLTFGDGTVSGTTLNGAFQAGQRTSDFGTWAPTGRRSYEVVSEAFILFDSTPNPPLPSFHRGTHRITQSIRLAHDRFTGVAVSDFFDPAGTLLMTLCAQAVGKRMP
jgi:hypothetical protein